MALESVTAAETAIQSNDDNDLEDGEIPSDEDDEPVPVVEATKPAPEPSKPPAGKTDSPKHKTFDNNFGKNKKAENIDRLNRQKSASGDDWAGNIEKAIKARLDEEKMKNHENSKSRSRSNKNKNRKRNREEKEEERARDQKKKRLSDEENANEDDDEMLFVRGASPARKGSHENSSPPRRPLDHDGYNSGSDYDDRNLSNRHRDDNKRGGGRSGRRGGVKNERGGKNKTRAQLRNERNSRRNQGNDHLQDPDAICVYYMQGKCHRGDDCPFSHNALPPRKMELCKFYLMDCCAKRDKCLYMHHDFPCKFFHTGLNCTAGENCKFSHQPMSEQVKSILLKHLETAPKEILGNFPRLSREGAMYLINATEKSLAHGQDVANQKIPSLFELKVPVPTDSMSNSDHGKDEGDDHHRDRHKDRKSSSGKKTRWGSNDDRVPYDMLVQTQIGLHLGKNKDKMVPTNFYGEGGPNDESKKDKDSKEESTKPKDSAINSLSTIPKDVDLRQLLSGKTPKKSQVVNLADEAASLTKSKLDDESDRDEETDLVIEVPDDEGKNKDKDKDSDKKKILEKSGSTANKKHEVKQKKEDPKADSSEKVYDDWYDPEVEEIQKTYALGDRKNDEYFDKLGNMDQKVEPENVKTDPSPDIKQEINQEIKKDDNEDVSEDINQDDWYSDDTDEDDDDDNQLTIDAPKEEEEEEEKEKKPEVKEDPLLQPASIPEPAAIVDKLGDLSKIDISMEVSKILSSIKAKSSLNSVKHDKDSVPNVKKETNTSPEIPKPVIPEISQFSKISSGSNSPRLSPTRLSAIPVAPQPTAASRDPRMSRDPRQRREERQNSFGSSGSTSSASKVTDSKESRSLRLETSIYSSGIIAQDAAMDTDLRAKLDQDLRRKDMDLRCFPPGPNFGDTDLRLGGAHYSVDAVKSGDVDLRPMLGLPFKPVPSHVPCTEIDAGITSHPPISYKVYVVDLPRPDYTGLKLTKNDPQVKYDPRLRKIFRLPSIKDDIADSPMSPPPVKVLDTPKSPPLVRTDPRRKALEAAAPPKIIPTTVQQHPIAEQSIMPGMAMGMGAPYMSGSNNMPVPGMGPTMGPSSSMGSSQNLVPGSMMMSGNPMMGNMGGNMGGRIDGNMGGRIDGNMGGRIDSNMGGRMDGNMGGRMDANMGGRMDANMGGRMDGNMGSRMDGNMGGRIDGNMGGRIDGNMAGRMDRDMGGRMDNNMGRAMGGNMDGGMGGRMDGNMGPMMRDGSGMGNNGGPMGAPMRMGNMGPGPNHPGPAQGQINQYDPRYSNRGNGVGLLGPGPQQMGGYNDNVRQPYDGPSGRYPADNFNNYGNMPNSDPRSDPRGFNPNGPMLDEPGFVSNPSDWNDSQARANRKDRRRAGRGKFGGPPRKKNV